MLSEFRNIVVVSRKGELKEGSKEVEARGRKRELFMKNLCQLVILFCL